LEAAEFLAETGRARVDLFRKRLIRAAADPASEEAIHDLRVSIRRVLAWLDVRDALLGPDPRLLEARSSLKTLMNPLGKLRDAHVKRDWIRTIVPEGDEPSYLYAVLVANDILRWEARVRERLGAGSAALPRIPAAGKHAKAVVRGKIGTLAGRRLRALEKEVEKSRETALDPAHPEALHRMRLAFKKYRYAAEVLSPLFPGATEKTMKRLHDFQTLLGTIHDCDVILAEAASFRRGILGREKECALEIAFRALREKRFGEFRRKAGTAERLLRVFGTVFRP
jgi:CHAD domain-containing protein